MKLDSIYVVVSDMATAREFYAEIFEREPVLIDDRFTGFDLGGVLFGLFNVAFFGEPVDTRSVVYGNNCVANIRVAGIDSLHQRLRRLSIPEVTDVQTSGEYRLFQIQDADGNRVEFYER